VNALGADVFGRAQMLPDDRCLALVELSYSPVPRTRAESRKVESGLKRDDFGESLDSVVAATRKPSFLDDVPRDETLAVKLLYGGFMAFTFCEEKQVFLPALQEAADVVLIAFNAVVFGVLLNVRFLVFLAHDIPDWKLGLRAVVEELETALGPETVYPEFPFMTSELLSPRLRRLARHRCNTTPQDSAKLPMQAGNPSLSFVWTIDAT